MKITKTTLKLYSVLRDSNQWLTVEEVSCLAGTNSKTSTRHIRQLVNAGVLDKVILYPTHLYRLTETAHTTELGKILEAMLCQLSEAISLNQP